MAGRVGIMEILMILVVGLLLLGGTLIILLRRRKPRAGFTVVRPRREANESRRPDP